MSFFLSLLVHYDFIFFWTNFHIWIEIRHLSDLHYDCRKQKAFNLCQSNHKWQTDQRVERQYCFSYSMIATFACGSFWYIESNHCMPTSTHTDHRIGQSIHYLKEETKNTRTYWMCTICIQTVKLFLFRDHTISLICAENGRFWIQSFKERTY